MRIYSEFEITIENTIQNYVFSESNKKAYKVNKHKKQYQSNLYKICYILEKHNIIV